MAIKLKNTDLKIVKGNTRIKSVMLGDKVIYGVEIQMPYKFSVQNNKAILIGLTEYGKLLSAVDIPPIYNGFPIAEIANNAFDGCIKMTSVSIPASVTKIVDAPFFHCDGLKSITVDKNNTAYRIDGNCLIETSTKKLMVGFDNSVIPTDGSVTSIGGGAFKSRTGLTSITVPNSVTSIGVYVFAHCSGLTSVTIPNSVTSIGYGAFKNCILLTSITMPNTLTNIADELFSNCSGLTSITIPNSVTSIGREAFAGTAWLNSQPDGLVYAGKVAYRYKGIMPKNTKITLRDDTKGIAGDAFNGCSGLASITIPNSVTSIGDLAFYNCSGLTSITIPSSVTSIGYQAFAHCSGLTSVTIPSSVTYIGDLAFHYCTKLTTINCEAPSQPIGWDSSWLNGCNATVVWGYKGA